ncbi:MAG TPA: hypothetical protein VM489_12525 [Burkholderiales bacterium]|nr:hypothetical protein [Burkholderiales bacterium]
MPKQSFTRSAVVGVAWFDRRQWKRLAEVVEDPNELEPTYEQWQQGAQSAVHAIESEGRLVERVHIEVQSLVSWCKDKGLPVNGRSRAEYVAQIVRRRHGLGP